MLYEMHIDVPVALLPHFISRDLAPIRQGTSSLGPLVTAQSITGGHRSVT